MVALVRTHTPSINTAPASNASTQAQGSSIQRAIKDTYKLAGWTPQGSSDGTTAGLDGVDRLSADNKYVWDSGSNSRSWISLKHPTKNLWRVFAYSTGAANQHLFNLRETTAAPTGGSTTADPTTNSTFTRTWSNLQYIRATVAPTHYHVDYTPQGDVWAFTSTDGVGYAAFSMGDNLLANPETNITYNTFGWARWNDSSPGGFELLRGTDVAVFDNSGNIFTSRGGMLNYDIGVAFLDQADGDVGTVGAASTWPLLAIGIGIVTALTGGTSIGFLGTMVDISYAPNGANTAQGKQEPPSPAAPVTAHFGRGMFPVGGVTPTF